jgi:hypothetical protein
MIRSDKKTEPKNDLTKKLDSFLNTDTKNCGQEECLMQQPEEIVKREHKKIITNDGRQLLSEYTI